MVDIATKEWSSSGKDRASYFDCYLEIYDREDMKEGLFGQYKFFQTYAYGDFREIFKVYEDSIYFEIEVSDFSNETERRVECLLNDYNELVAEKLNEKIAIIEQQIEFIDSKSENFIKTKSIQEEYIDMSMILYDCINTKNRNDAILKIIKALSIFVLNENRSVAISQNNTVDDESIFAWKSLCKDAWHELCFNPEYESDKINISTADMSSFMKQAEIQCIGK